MNIVLTNYFYFSPISSIVSDDANLTPAPTIPDDGATSPAGAKEGNYNI